MKLCLLTSLPAAAMQLIYYVQTAGVRFSDVIVEHDGQTHYDIFEQYARINGFALHFVDDPNGDACLDLVRALGPDVLMIVTGTIIRTPLLAVPRIGTLNAHAAILPQYRGTDTPLWAVLDGGPQGVAVHWVEPTIDTGPIVATRVLELLPGDTVQSILWRNHHVNKWQTVVDALRIIERGDHRGTPQRATDGSQYFLMHPKLRAIVDRVLAENPPRPDRAGAAP